MKLRCVFCGRQQSDEVTLLDSFQCADKDDCMAAQIRKSNPPQIAALYFDAAVLGTPLPEGNLLGVGVYTMINGKHAPEWSGAKDVPIGTVSDGEWIGLIYALSAANLMRKQDNYTFRIFGDSQFVVEAFNDRCKISAKFVKYYEKAHRIKQKLGLSLLSTSWIPREQNREADKLSKQGLLMHTTAHAGIL